MAWEGVPVGYLNSHCQDLDVDLAFVSLSNVVLIFTVNVQHAANHSIAQLIPLRKQRQSPHLPLHTCRMGQSIRAVHQPYRPIIPK